MQGNRVDDTSSMQSLHIVSEVLSKRHPYPGPAFYDDFKASIAYGHRGISRLVEILAVPGLEVAYKQEALEFMLKQLSHQESKMKLLDPDALERIVSLTDDPDCEVRELSCKILASLALVMQGRVALTRAEGIRALCMRLEDEDPAVRESSVTALSNFSQSPDGRVVLAEIYDGLAVAGIVSSLKDTSRYAVESAIVSLTNLMRVDVAIEHALEAGVVENLTTLLNRKQSILLVLSCMLNLCGNKNGKKTAIRDNSVEAISTWLGNKNPEIRRLASGCLMAISIDEDGKMAAFTHAAKQLVSMLRDTDPDCAGTAKQTVRNISENPSARKKLDTMMATDPPLQDMVEKDLRAHLASDCYIKHNMERANGGP